MAWYPIVALLTLTQMTSLAWAALPGVINLNGDPDFRQITLHWEYDSRVADLAGFHVTYCELQAWGPHRCRSKMLSESSGNRGGGSALKLKTYSLQIGGLRLATNYTFRVRASGGGGMMDRERPAEIILRTKGFSARASRCLPQESEIEVETGPYFGGRIGAEDGPAGRCSVQGDPDSSRHSYTLRIDHNACGSRVNGSTVASFVLVQENLPILTHSSRRFLVLCTYQPPETFTVRAGLSLPGGDSNAVGEGRAIPADVIPDPQLSDITDSRIAHQEAHGASPVAARVAAAPHATEIHHSGHHIFAWTLAAAGVVGIAAALFWWKATKINLQHNSTPLSDDTSSLSVFENLENSLRDCVASAAIIQQLPSETVEHCQSLSISDSGPSSLISDSGSQQALTFMLPDEERDSDLTGCVVIESPSQSEAEC